MQYLSGQYLIDPAGQSFHFILPAVIFFVLCAMLATTWTYFVAATNNKRAPIARMARRVQGIAWTIAIIGLILIGFRWGGAALPLVRSRLVLYIVALGFVALGAYVLLFLRLQLPKLNADYESRLLRRQYQPRSRRRR